MALELSQFSVNRAAFEVRYDFAALLWDRAGVINSEIRKKHYPKLENRQVDPNNQSLRLAPNLELSVQTDKSFIVCKDPSSDLGELNAAASKLFPIIIQRLELTDFTRIGLRIFFRKTFSTKQECAEFMLNAVPYLRRHGKHFNIEAEVTDPTIALRWEGKTTGCLATFRVIEAKLNIDVPFEFSIDLVSPVELIAVSLDVDYYAHALTAVTKFNSSALIENWAHLIRRDVGAFVHG
jgi:hypothetical protein